jgi:hypothetical protein
MKKLILTACAIALFSLAACVSKNVDKSGVAQDSSFGYWQVVVTSETDPNALCYAVSTPMRSEGSFEGKRTSPYLMATRRQSGKIEISASSGYPYKKDADVELETDSELFVLKPRESIAWALDDEQDKSMLAKLKKLGTAELRGVNDKGQTTVDVYSTAGFEESVARVRELCP